MKVHVFSEIDRFFDNWSYYYECDKCHKISPRYSHSVALKFAVNHVRYHQFVK